jgi:hypothetical protein
MVAFSTSHWNFILERETYIGIMNKFNEWKMRREMSEKHNQTLEDHVKSNVDMAIDQAYDYGGLEGAFHSFLQNVYDSVLEDGYTGDEATSAVSDFVSEFKKRTGLSW